MIRIEGIPVVARRLCREPGALRSRTNVRTTPRVVVAIGNALIVGIKAALQTTSKAA
jgi:hypothetical protein